MRLVRLSVEHFQCIRSAELDFGRGLNVLYGPNDLGKSSLAWAIRAVLLLQHNAAAHERFVSWYGDGEPRVALTLCDDEDRYWRVTKTFGGTGSGRSHLESSKDGQTFITEVSGRQVDDKLRTMLRWGIQRPWRPGPARLSLELSHPGLAGRAGQRPRSPVRRFAGEGPGRVGPAAPDRGAQRPGPGSPVQAGARRRTGSGRRRLHPDREEAATAGARPSSRSPSSSTSCSASATSWRRRSARRSPPRPGFARSGSNATGCCSGWRRAGPRWPRRRASSPPGSGGTLLRGQLEACLATIRGVEDLQRQMVALDGQAPRLQASMAAGEAALASATGAAQRSEAERDKARKRLDSLAHEDVETDRRLRALGERESSAREALYQAERSVEKASETLRLARTAAADVAQATDLASRTAREAAAADEAVASAVAEVARAEQQAKRVSAERVEPQGQAVAPGAEPRPELPGADAARLAPRAARRAPRGRGAPGRRAIGDGATAAAPDPAVHRGRPGPASRQGRRRDRGGGGKNPGGGRRRSGRHRGDRRRGERPPGGDQAPAPLGQAGGRGPRRARRRDPRGAGGAVPAGRGRPSGSRSRARQAAAASARLGASPARRADGPRPAPPGWRGPGRDAALRCPVARQPARPRSGAAGARRRRGGPGSSQARTVRPRRGDCPGRGGAARRHRQRPERARGRRGARPRRARRRLDGREGRAEAAGGGAGPGPRPPSPSCASRSPAPAWRRPAGPRSALQAELASLGVSGAAPRTQPGVSVLRATADRLAAEVRDSDTELAKARGALEQVGGAIVRERQRDLDQAIQQARDARARDRDRVRRLEAARGHPPRQRVGGGRPPRPRPGRSRQRTLPVAHGEVATASSSSAHTSRPPACRSRGNLREIGALSAGTQDQLATLLRVCIAEQLQSAIVLDDHLSQSDPDRIAWFNAILRDAARQVQIILITCRPSEVLAPDELPASGSRPTRERRAW